jgi:hypothetical protein
MNGTAPSCPNSEAAIATRTRFSRSPASRPISASGPPHRPFAYFGRGPLGGTLPIFLPRPAFEMEVESLSFFAVTPARQGDYDVHSPRFRLFHSASLHGRAVAQEAGTGVTSPRVLMKP